MSDRVFNLADLYEIVADAVPDRDALVCGEERRTFAQLDERANRAGHALLDAGLPTGAHVGILAANRVEWVEAMLGCFKARLVPVNVNYRYVEAELAYLFDNADLAGLVVSEELAGRAAAAIGAAGSNAVGHVLTMGDEYEAALAAASPGRDFGARSPDDHYILYTGGTTGMPKGVVWRAEDIFFAAMGGGGLGWPKLQTPDELAERVVTAPGLSFLVCPPLMHGAAQWALYICLFGGGKAVVMPGSHFDPREVWRTVEREKAQTLVIVGDAMARPLADVLAQASAESGDEDGPGGYDLSSLVGFGSGGAILSPAVKDQIRSLLPSVMIVDSFGASETGAQGSSYGGDAAKVASGFPVSDQMQVLDDELRPVEPGSGVVGKLARRGHIPLGYYKDPDKTASIVAEVDGERWIIPGDFATVEADGTITVLGRGSVCINTGGEKVFPEEVESVLKAHPSVFDAVVVGLPDERFGERVVAVVQARPGASPALDDLAPHCRASLAGYKVPRDLVLVDRVPRTPVGKPDYKAAKDLAAGARN